MEELKVTADALRQKVDQDGKLMSGINNTIKNSMRNEKNLQVLREKMSKEFRNLANFESNHSLVGVYTEVATGLDGISKSHLSYIQQVEGKVLPVLNDYQNKIKEVKTSLAAYQSKKSALEKQVLNYNRTTEPTKRDAAQKALAKAQLESDQETMSFTKRVQNYQMERMSDCKQVLLHTINAEMHYHAKALERLSELAFKVYSIDDKKEAQIMIEGLLTPPRAHPQQNQPQGPGHGQIQGQIQGQVQGQGLDRNLDRNLAQSQNPRGDPNLGQSQNRPVNQLNLQNLAQNQNQNMAQSQAPYMGQSQNPNMGLSQNPNIGQGQNRPQNAPLGMVRPP